jgi:NAD(P)H-hydrate epimerase
VNSLKYFDYELLDVSYGDDGMITSREMRALELNSEYYGVSRLQLMENAGSSVAAEIVSKFKPDETRVAVFCGSGGNGGDGFVVARHLACHGFKVEVILAGRSADIVDKAARRNWIALQTLKDTITLYEVYNSMLIPSVEAEVVVDALLGIGLKGDLRSPILQMVNKINEMKAFRVSVDVPSGINSDSGEVLGNAVKADVTVTFHKAKPGLMKAKQYTGDLIVGNIGLPKEFERFVGPGDISLVEKNRPPESHKGDFGKLLVIGGNEVYSGAPALVALAALRTGVDIAYIAAPEKVAHTISAMSPSLITVKLKGEHLNPSNAPIIKRYLEASTAVVIGPGLGQHRETTVTVKEVLRMIEKEKTPLLLDADGLKAFAEFKRKLKCPLLLTPHSGEYKILTGRKLPEDLEQRAAKVGKVARELEATILSKGHVDVVSDGKRVKFNFVGNPGMTVGGTGDVLSGIVGAFLAQGADPFEAAVAGAFINGAAGDFVQREKGYHMVPTDLIEQISSIMDNSHFSF